MRILIVGASGFIGRHVVRSISRRPEQEVVATFRTRPSELQGVRWRHADLTDPTELAALFQLSRPDVVLHLAAEADVGTAERDPSRATSVNVGGTTSIAGLCEKHGARLVFVSTEYVFSGRRGFYREDEVPEPTTHYGRTKRDAELAVARLCSRWSILRTSIVYGWPHPGKRNFAPWLIDSLERGHPHHARTDVYRTPVYVGTLVAAMEKLVADHFQGVFHVAGSDWVSMYDFATSIARAFELDSSLVVPTGQVEPHHAPSLGTEPQGSRVPDMLGLNCNLSMQTLGLEYTGLGEGVAALRKSAPSL